MRLQSLPVALIGRVSRVSVESQIRTTGIFWLLNLAEPNVLVIWSSATGSTAWVSLNAQGHRGSKSTKNERVCRYTCWKINATIRDRYYVSAAGVRPKLTDGAVFIIRFSSS